MNPEDREELFQNAQLQGAVEQANAVAMQNHYQREEIDKSLAEAQLECDTTLKNIYHRLKQDVLKPDSKGKMDWHPIEDESKRRLTNDGVERIMELMSFYINKENLLSNFSEEQINRIMLTFRLAFSANIFMRYQLYFREPTIEECRVILEKYIERKAKERSFIHEMKGDKETLEEAKKQIAQETEIEYELEKIRKDRLKENLSEFELLFEELSQMVLATLNRAWKGEERGSLRRHTNISEVIGGRQQGASHPRDSGGFFRWGRR